MDDTNIKYICVLDFEATCWENMTNRFHEIIEFPSVLLKWDVNEKEVQKIAEIQMYVKPKFDHILSDFCTDLTGITQNLVDDGIEFPKALALHEKWLNDNIPDYNIQCVHILTCGAWDIGTYITKEFRTWEIYSPPKIYTEFINIKKDFEEFYSHNAGGMMGMLNYLGLKLKGSNS